MSVSSSFSFNFTTEDVDDRISIELISKSKCSCCAVWMSDVICHFLKAYHIYQSYWRLWPWCLKLYSKLYGAEKEVSAGVIWFVIRRDFQHVRGWWSVEDGKNLMSDAVLKIQYKDCRWESAKRPSELIEMCFLFASHLLLQAFWKLGTGLHVKDVTKGRRKTLHAICSVLPSWQKAHVIKNNHNWFHTGEVWSQFRSERPNGRLSDKLVNPVRRSYLGKVECKASSLLQEVRWQREEWFSEGYMYISESATYGFSGLKLKIVLPHVIESHDVSEERQFPMPRA